MSQDLNLREIEKKAFRAAHQDGLWDIYIGGIVLSMSALAYSLESEAFPATRFALYVIGLGIFYLFFWAGKKYLTAPRLGQVKFGTQRQRRKRTLASVLIGIVLLQVIILAGTIFFWANPQAAANLGFGKSDPNLERLLVAVIGALFVGPSTALIAYFNDFHRGYYIAFIISLAVFSLIWFEKPIYLIVAGLLILLPGLVLFIRFIREHPLPPTEASHV
jgi:uncharacterized membrane protein